MAQLLSFQIVFSSTYTIVDIYVLLFIEINNIQVGFFPPTRLIIIDFIKNTNISETDSFRRECILSEYKTWNFLILIIVKSFIIGE